MATISPTDAVAEVFGVKLSGVPAKIAWSGAVATHSRAEQVFLEGVGDTGALAQQARANEPSQLRRPRELR